MLSYTHHLPLFSPAAEVEAEAGATMPGVAAWVTAAVVAAAGGMGEGEPVGEAAAVVAVGTEEGEGTG